MNKKLHFIAIAGTGMGSAAGLFKQAGYEVRGSDEAIYPPMSGVLESLQIEAMSPFSGDNLRWGPDQVVVGNVCRRDHVEVEAARSKGLPMTSFPALLGERVLASRTSVVVAGTHGKTTTSTMLSFLLREAGLEPGWLIGGVPVDLPGGFNLGTGRAFVLEGDEYDTAFFDKNPKFVRYRPNAAIITSVEFDHADIYDSFETIKEQFYRLSSLVPPGAPLLLSADNTECQAMARARCGGILYGLEGEGADLYARQRVPMASGGVRFELVQRGVSMGHFELTLTGEHNLRNMVAALGMASALGADVEALRSACARFKGVKRRQEVLGERQGVVLMDDFGHHPRAVELTIGGLKSSYGRILAVFDPRSATSRRAIFQHDYERAFQGADMVFVGPPYDQSRIPPEDRFSSQLLKEALEGKGIPAFTADTADDLLQKIVPQLRPHDLLIFFSSGSFAGLPKKTLAALSE